MWTGTYVVHFVASGDTAVAKTLYTNVTQVRVIGHQETNDAPEFFFKLIQCISRPKDTHTERLKKTKTDERMETIKNATKEQDKRHEWQNRTCSGNASLRFFQ